MGGREAVADAGRHRVGLGPDDLVADRPAVLDEREQKPFRGPEQGFSWCSFSWVGAVAVAEVEPERAGGLEDAVQFAGQIAEFTDPLVDVGFEPELAVDAVVAQSEVRRAGDDAVDRLGGQRLGDRECITFDDAVGRQLHDAPPPRMPATSSGNTTVNKPSG